MTDTRLDAPRGRARAAGVAAVLAVAVVAWVLVPRLVVNRSHYGLWELLILATGVLAVPGTYALAELVWGPPGSATRRARRWLWSVVVTLAAFVLVLSVAGPRGGYPDDRIPGFMAGLLASAVAVALTVVGLVSAVLSRLIRRSARGS